MYGLPNGRLTRRTCSHNCLHSEDGHQTDGTYIETCTRCGAQWAVWPSGARVLARWGR